MVKFEIERGRQNKSDGAMPMEMIFDHYLTAQTWTTEFVSRKATTIYKWIRFPDLNLFFYDESILLENL